MYADYSRQLVIDGNSSRPDIIRCQDVYKKYKIIMNLAKNYTASKIHHGQTCQGSVV
jgi:hypothetical protein